VSDDVTPQTVDGEDRAIGRDLPAIPEQARYSNAPTVALQEIAWTARALVNAATLPKALQGKPGDILAGRELGIGPMASTRMVHIISGQTSIATELKLGLAAREGHEVIPIDEGPGYCVVGCRQHPDAPAVGWRMEHETPVPDAPVQAWTIASEIMVESWEGERGARSKTEAPLVAKANWRSYQRDMLFWRAAGQFMRRHCPALAGGLYTLEELGGGGV
jgi:hypothetical protein